MLYFKSVPCLIKKFYEKLFTSLSRNVWLNLSKKRP